jgi:hypothetical protein
LVPAGGTPQQGRVTSIFSKIKGMKLEKGEIAASLGLQKVSAPW